MGIYELNNLQIPMGLVNIPWTIQVDYVIVMILIVLV